MPISVKCPECDTAYKVPDEAAGKAIKCKKCGAKVPVPAAGGDDDLANLGGNEDAGGDTKGTKKPGSSKLFLIIGGVVLFFGCCCVLPPGISGLGYYLGWFGNVNIGGKDLGKDMPKEIVIKENAPKDFLKQFKIDPKDFKIDKKDKKASLDRQDRLAPSVPPMAFVVRNPVREAFWPEVSIVRLSGQGAPDPIVT
jgi:predicted Zn finger-like uncharacterized protein